MESDRIGLLQCVLTGRAQEAISSLTAGDSSDYRKVKVAVLKVYELVLDAYHQRIETRERRKWPCCWGVFLLAFRWKFPL